MEEYLTQLYYNPKRSGSLGGVERLYRDVKKEGKYDISRAQLKKWLMKQDTYTLHKPARRHYKRNRVIVGGIDELWQMDLADMQAHAAENDGYRYLLVCIDVFSKYVWVIPLKTKTGPALVMAFKKILESGRKPQKIQTDEGTEFFNKHFKDLMKAEEIQLYNTYNETKASIVERVIRTLKTRMWRYFTAKKTMRYIDVLQDLVDSYNKSKHRSIQKKPINVTQKNEREVWHTLYGEPEKKGPVKYKFEIGDQVRISKMKRTFEKGYLPKFSKEIFTVSQQIPRDPPVYKLKDYDQEELSGTFYNEELQKVIKEDDVYEVEKILKSHGKGFYGQGFYLTLPSESSKDLFPENNASEYSVRLPHWIHLKGEWEIGLHSIAYTRRNIIHHLDGTILYGYPENDGTTAMATTGKMQNHYSSVSEYVSNINESLEESHVNKTEIEFTINTDGKVTITLRDGYRVRLRREQAIVLGFMNFEDSAETYYIKYTKTGSYKANLHREMNILVYCNIVQPQIVGDKLIPLVATVPYQKTSESYDETFYAMENIHYIPVQTKAFQNVKVHLRSSTEESIPFEHGRAAITLHLKPLNYFD